MRITLRQGRDCFRNRFKFWTGFQTGREPYSPAQLLDGGHHPRIFRSDFELWISQRLSVCDVPARQAARPISWLWSGTGSPVWHSFPQTVTPDSPCQDRTKNSEWHGLVSLLLQSLTWPRVLLSPRINPYTGNQPALDKLEDKEMTAVCEHVAYRKGSVYVRAGCRSQRGVGPGWELWTL